MYDLLLMITIALLVASFVLVLISANRGTRSQGVMKQRIDAILKVRNDEMDSEERGPLERLLAWLGASRNRDVGSSERHKIRWLMSQAGWHRRDLRILYRGVFVLLPFVGLLLGVTISLGTGGVDASMFSAGFLGFGTGLLAPRYLLRYVVARRRDRIIDEVPIMVRMLSLLFDAGLSLDQAFKALHDEATALIPELAAEIERMRLTVATGMGQIEALERMGKQVDVQELTDSLQVLTQAARHGGGVRQSLTRLAETIEDCRRTRLRERVGQLSAKMTVVMVVFLFPALFIFLAGPGFMALGSALVGVND